MIYLLYELPKCRPDLKVYPSFHFLWCGLIALAVVAGASACTSCGAGSSSATAGEAYLSALSWM